MKSGRPGSVSSRSAPGPTTSMLEMFRQRPGVRWAKLAFRTKATMCSGGSSSTKRSWPAFGAVVRALFAAAQLLSLDDRNLLPVVQPVALDGHRHVVGVEPHRHVELEVGGDLDVEKVTIPVVVSI